LKRVFVSLPDGVWSILKKEYLGNLGDSESEVVRNIVIAYLSDHGYFVNEKGQGVSDKALKEVNNKLMIAENLIESIIDALEEKGHITFDDVDKIMKKRISKLAGSKASEKS
jgi:hypothetical protein